MTGEQAEVAHWCLSVCTAEEEREVVLRVEGELGVGWGRGVAATARCDGTTTAPADVPICGCGLL